MTRLRSIQLRPAALPLLGLILAGIAYRTLFEGVDYSTLDQEFEQQMFSATSSGQAVVVFLAAWLLFRRWDRVRRLFADAASPALAPVLLAAGVVIYAWATHTGARDLLALSLIFNLLGFGALLWGPRGIGVLSVPVAFLIFAMNLPAPLLNQLLWKVQIWTAHYAGFLLGVLGVDHFVTGDQLILSGQNFAIIEACSGVRSAETLTMLAVLMSDLFRRRALHATVLIATAPFLAFALNGFRVVTLILNPHSEIVAIHTLQGISILLAGLLLLYLVDGLLESSLSASEPRVNPNPSRAPAPPARRLIPCVAVTALLVGLSFALPRWERPPKKSLPFPDSVISKQIAGWRSTPLKSDLSFMGIVRSRAWVERRYERGDKAVRLFAGVGGHEKRHVSPLSPKTALPGSGWTVERATRIELEPNGLSVRANVVNLGNGAQRRLVLAWVEGSRGPVHEILRWILALDTSHWVRDREIVALRLSTRLAGIADADLEDAKARLREFYRAVRPQLDRLGYPRGYEP